MNKEPFQKGTKVYISGKITGDANYFIKFARIETILGRQGYIVLNPESLPEGMKPSDYMRICFAMIDSADIVAFLPDYKESKGALLEKAWCEYTGKQTMYLDETGNEIEYEEIYCPLCNKYHKRRK